MWFKQQYLFLLMLILLQILSTVFTGLYCENMQLSKNADPCEEARAGTAAATIFAKDSSYQAALINIKTAFAADRNEHCISFGKDTTGNIIASSISGGSATSGKVPAVANAFADIHNHPDNLPPDAGDLYGLIRLLKNNPNYKTRFVVTVNGTVYALLVTNTATALAFTEKSPPQPPAFAGGPPGLPVAITDEAREMKYRYNCTDEMVLAFILEKYNTGIALLKQQSDGIFKKLVTTVGKNENEIFYRVGSCL
jgi:hypothetical protein